LEQLREWGVDISAGQLNRILTEQKDIFHDEKDEILLMGLKVSAYVNVPELFEMLRKRLITRRI